VAYTASYRMGTGGDAAGA